MSQQQLGKVKTRCPGKGLPPGRKRSLKPGMALSELMAPDPTGCSVDGHTHMCTHTCKHGCTHVCSATILGCRAPSGHSLVQHIHRTGQPSAHVSFRAPPSP